MKPSQPRNKSNAAILAGAPTAASKSAGCPESATRGWIVALGFITFVAALWYVRSVKMQDVVQAALICMGATALVNFTLDALVLKVHQRESTGMDWKRRTPSWNRVLIKFTGLLASFGFVSALYWLFTEYHGDFYQDYWALLRKILPWWAGLAIPYFYFVDAKQTDPHDGYYHAGLAALLQFRKVNPKLPGPARAGPAGERIFHAAHVQLFCERPPQIHRLRLFDPPGFSDVL